MENQQINSCYQYKTNSNNFQSQPLIAYLISQQLYFRKMLHLRRGNGLRCAETICVHGKPAAVHGTHTYCCCNQYHWLVESSHQPAPTCGQWIGLIMPDMGEEEGFGFQATVVAESTPCLRENLSACSVCAPAANTPSIILKKNTREIV